MIVDASVFLAILLDESSKSSIVRTTQETDLRSPDIVPYEIANALSSLMRRELIQQSTALRAFTLFKQVPVRLVAVNITQALKISARYGIYAYDAFYLEVAQRRSLPLLTLDKKMQRIAAEMGIVTVEVEG